MAFVGNTIHVPRQQKTISIISSFLRDLGRIRIERSKPVLDLVLGENMDSGDSVLYISVPAFYGAVILITDNCMSLNESASI